MTQYRVGGEMAVVLSDKDGAIVAYLKPGLVIEGDLVAVPADKPKRQRGYQDKAVRAERDYEDKSLS